MNNTDRLGMQATSKRLFIVALILAMFFPFASALDGYENPKNGFSADSNVRVLDTAVYNTGYLSEDGTDWQAFTLTGTTRGNWIVGEATADVDLSTARYVAIFSCSWNQGWSCGSTWQVADRGDPSAQHYLVQNGVAQADIVVSPDAPNMVALAAEYFQNDIEEMTGALLPIRNTPGNDYDFHVYIGESQYTQQLGITSQGTQDDGYKIVSGENYLVLLGDDTPYARDALSDSEWDALTAPDVWRNTYEHTLSRHSGENIYSLDGRGSMNAVHAFLYDQGMRWYYPNTFGTITPEKNDIRFTQYQKTVNPDHPMRAYYLFYKHFGHLSNSGLYPEGIRFGSSDEHLRWTLSIGKNNERKYVTGRLAHGMYNIIGREETMQNHPEYYAIWNGVRQNVEDPKPNLCSEELKAATIRYVVTMIEQYDAQYVSIWPSDGFGRVSEHSQECRDKATPERGGEGAISDYVWNFVNDVAWAIHDAYGDERYVFSGAYSAYRLPPQNIDNSRRLAPNIAVMIADNRRDAHNPEAKQRRRAIIDDWNELVPGQVFLNDKSLLSNWLRNSVDHQVPQFHPQIIEEDIRYTTGKSMGTFDEVAMNHPGGEDHPNSQLGEEYHDSFAANGLNMYLTAKLHWDSSIDVDTLLDEYYSLYYGSAADTMQEFVEYSEATLADNRINPVHLKHMRSLAQQAIAEVPDNSVYEERIQYLLDMMNSNYLGEEVEISSCQTLISPGTTYKLTQDLSVSQTCFDLDHQGVTLDCQGHTIQGSSEDPLIDVDGRQTNRGHYLTLKNCNVVQQGSGYGIYIKNIDNATLVNNTAQANARAIWVANIEGLRLYNNTGQSQNGDGIYVQYGSSQGTNLVSRGIIRGNTATSVNSHGSTLYNIKGDLVENNEFTSSGSNGLRMFNPVNATLKNNYISSTSKNGLYVSNPTNLVQEGNTIIDG